MDATEQHQTLRAIWPKWRAIAHGTTKATERQSAQEAALRLYKHYKLDAPRISWIDSIHRLPFLHTGAPFISHMRDTLIHSVWPHLADPAWVCSQIGYERRSGVFRLPRNLRLLTRHAYLTPQQRERRPAWLSPAVNMISQFDVDVLAIRELAHLAGVQPDLWTRELADIVEQLVGSCFAAVLFETTCMLVKKPTIVAINEVHQLSAQGGPAFQAYVAPEHEEIDMIPGDGFPRPNPHRLTLYITNGGLISKNREPDTSWTGFAWGTMTRRLAVIEYMGWEAFLKLMKHERRARNLHHDRYGVLYSVSVGAQEFRVVEVTNRTPEPDGKYRRYVIPVDHWLRPLPDPNDPSATFGDPQELTALNAVASTFGMTGEQYAKLNLRES